MLDGEGRLIEYLRLSVTDRCNCRCTYCMPAGGVPMLGHRDILSFEELTEVVTACAQLGVRKVRLTGGEPLVRRGLPELVRMIRAVPGVEELAMTTNATLLAPVAAARYAELTRGGSLEDALAGLAAARDAGFSHTKVNCVLMGGVNDADVPRLAELARTEPIDVRFIELMPMGPCAGWPKARFIPAETVLEAVPGLQPLRRDGVAELWHAPGWAGNVGLIRPMSHRFCDGCSRIRVTADGRLKPCLHSAAEIPLRGLHGEALLAELRRGIAAKPAYHHMDQDHASQSARDMNEIGG